LRHCGKKIGPTAQPVAIHGATPRPPNVPPDLKNLCGL